MTKTAEGPGDKSLAALRRLPENIEERQRILSTRTYESYHSKDQKLLEIGIGGIGYSPGQRLQALKPDNVKELAKSMSELGQLQPIVVRPHCHGGFHVVSGVHRLEAAKKLKWATIKCVMLDKDDEDTVELAEIDENLTRAELTLIEQGIHWKRKKEILEALHPEITRLAVMSAKAKNQMARQGGKAEPIQTIPKTFTQNEAEKTGHSSSYITTAISVASLPNIGKAVGTSIDKIQHVEALITCAKKDPAAAQDTIARAAKGEKIPLLKKKLVNEDLAEWIITHAEPSELPMLITWFESAYAQKVATLLRAARKSMIDPR